MTLDVVDRGNITAGLVACLVASQFPQWATEEVSPVALDGWDNTTFRLGSAMSVRLPSADAYVAQIDKEHRWLPWLAPMLPKPVPRPLAKGRPGCGFPRPWSIYTWLDGEPAVGDAVDVGDLDELATDLADFLRALYALPPVGPAPGSHSFSRGGPVSVWDEQTRALIVALRSSIDARGASAVWQAALDAAHDHRPVWVHGDITGANLLVMGGRLCGVLDFGCSAVGDPACDLTVAWTLFEGDSREQFKASIPVDDATWARARGWALWKALLHLSADLEHPGSSHRADHRVGWRYGAADVLASTIME